MCQGCVPSPGLPPIPEAAYLNQWAPQSRVKGTYIVVGQLLASMIASMALSGIYLFSEYHTLSTTLYRHVCDYSTEVTPSAPPPPPPTRSPHTSRTGALVAMKTMNGPIFLPATCTKDSSSNQRHTSAMKGFT